MFLASAYPNSAISAAMMMVIAFVMARPAGPAEDDQSEAGREPAVRGQVAAA